MLTKNNTSSDLTMKRQTRIQFANYIIQQQAVANGCLGRITIDGGSGGENPASIFTQIKEGERFTTVAERDLILASGACPTTTTSSSSGGGSDPSPPDPPATGSDYQWGVSYYSSTTSTSAILTRSSAIDSNGNIYIGGSYQNGKLTVQNYSSTSTAASKLITQTTFGLLPDSSTIPASFLIKYNSSGTAQWATNVTASATSSLCYNIGTDSDGNVYSLHQFSGTATVNSYTSRVDGSDITLTAYGTVASAGTTDILIVKHNSSGEVQWVAQISGASSELLQRGNSKNIGIDSNNNIYFTFESATTTTNSLTLKNFSSGGDGGSITFNTFGTYTGKSRSIYTCKINSAGSFQWLSEVKPIDAFFSLPYYACAVDSNSNVFIAFSCYTAASSNGFDLQSYNGLSGSVIQTTKWARVATLLGNSDGFVAKLNSDGVFEACARLGVANSTVDDPSIIIDGNNRVIATFQYSDSIGYNVDNKINIYSAGGKDASDNVVFTAWASLPVRGAAGGADASILVFNSSLVVQSATYVYSAISVATETNNCQIYSVDRDGNNNIFVNVRFNGTSVTISSFSSQGTGGENNNVNLTTFATLANSGTTSYDCAVVKYNSSLVTQWAVRINDVSTSESLVPYTLSVDRTNGYLYSAGEFIAGTTSAGVRFQNQGGVSGGAVTLTLAGQINSATTSGTSRQGYLVKYSA